MVKGRRGKKEKKRNATNEEEGTRNRERRGGGVGGKGKKDREKGTPACLGRSKAKPTNSRQFEAGGMPVFLVRSSMLLYRFYIASYVTPPIDRFDINLKAGKCGKKKCSG